MLSVRWETAGDVGGAALKRKAGALVEIGDFLGKFGADLGRAASPTALDLLELGEKNTGLRRLAEERMLEALSRAIEESGGRGGKLVGLHGDRLWRVYLGERTPTRLDFGARWAEGSRGKRGFGRGSSGAAAAATRALSRGGPGDSGRL